MKESGTLRPMTAVIEQRPATTDQPPVLVVLPGVNSGAYLFQPALQAFGATHHLLVLNTPGVDGMPLPLPFTVESYARLAAGVLAERGITSFSLLGHSLGGFAAQQLARMLPAQVERLVLVSTSMGQPDTARDLPLVKRKSGLDFWELAQAIGADPHTRMKTYFGDAFPQQNPQAYAAFISQRQHYLPKASVTLAHFSAGAAFSSRLWAGSLKVPTLVIHGTDDVMITPRAARRLARAIPQARYMELYGVGHFPMLEHAGFYPAVARFLAGHAEGTEAPPPEESWLKNMYNAWFKLHG